jgi:non-canonical (house-cleaning) NTP pyrophosphatase
MDSMTSAATASADVEPGVVRRVRKAVDASAAALIDQTAQDGKAISASNAPPAEPVQGRPRDGGLVHVVA